VAIYGFCHLSLKNWDLKLKLARQGTNVADVSIILINNRTMREGKDSFIFGGEANG